VKVGNIKQPQGHKPSVIFFSSNIWFLSLKQRRSPLCTLHRCYWLSNAIKRPAPNELQERQIKAYVLNAMRIMSLAYVLENWVSWGWGRGCCYGRRSHGEAIYKYDPWGHESFTRGRTVINLIRGFRFYFWDKLK